MHSSPVKVFDAPLEHLRDMFVGTLRAAWGYVYTWEKG